MSKETWKTKDGVVMLIKDMDNDHLVNTINLIIRKGIGLVKCGSWDAFSGDMYFDTDYVTFKELAETEPLNTMLYYAKKRGLVGRIKTNVID